MNIFTVDLFYCIYYNNTIADKSASTLFIVKNYYKTYK